LSFVQSQSEAQQSWWGQVNVTVQELDKLNNPRMEANWIITERDLKQQKEKEKNGQTFIKKTPWSSRPFCVLKCLGTRASRDFYLHKVNYD
jgi:hypothetical protein